MPDPPPTIWPSGSTSLREFNLVKPPITHAKIGLELEGLGGGLTTFLVDANPMAGETRHQNDRAHPHFNDGKFENAGHDRQTQNRGLWLSKYTARPPPAPMQPTTKDLSIPLILLDQDSYACPQPLHRQLGHGASRERNSRDRYCG